MKLKYIVAAIGLMASAASQATITAPITAPAGSGELALVVYDANASYTLDLGVSYASFLASSNSSGAISATLNSSNWTNFTTTEAGSINDWQYAVIGANTLNSTTYGSASVLSTINADGVDNGINGNFTSNNVQNASTQVANYFVNVNSTGTHPTVANGDSVNLVGSAAYFLTSGMNDFNGTLFGNNSTVGTAMQMDRLVRNAAPGSDPTETMQAGLVNFQQVGGNYVLSYTVAAVPEASGYAMAMAGLGALGFIGYRRRDRS